MKWENSPHLVEDILQSDQHVMELDAGLALILSYLLTDLDR